MRTLDDIVRRYTEWVIAWRWPVLILCLFIAVFASTGAQNLQFTADYKIYFGPKNPQLATFNALENTYTSSDNVFFVIQPQDGTVFTPENLTTLKWLTDEAWLVPHVTRVDSITNFQNTKADADDLHVGDLVTDETPLSLNEIGRIERITLSEPVLAGRLIAKDGRAAGVLVTLQFPGSDHSTHLPETVEAAQSLADQLRKRRPDMRVALTGIGMLNDGLVEASERDVSTLFPIMFMIIAAAMVVFLRSTRGAAATLIVVVLATGTAIGIAGWLGIRITPTSALAPVIIMTLSIADCVHILHSVLDNMREGRSRREALLESLRVNAEPVFLTSLTTTIGFLSLNFSDSPPYQDLGTISAIGVVAAWFFSMTFLPALVAVVPLSAGRRAKLVLLPMAKFGDFVIKSRNHLLVGVSVITLGLSALLPLNVLDDRFIEWFDESMPVRADTDFASENLTAPFTIEFSIGSGESSGITDPAYLEVLENFANWLRQQPRVTHVATFTDVMKRLNKSMHGDDPAWYRLPNNRETAAQYLLLYEFSLPYGLDLNSQLNVDKSASRLIATVDATSASHIRDVKTDAETWLRANAPMAMWSEGTGTSVLFAYVAERNIRSMLSGTLIAFALIAFTLVLMLRSIRLGLISLIPNIFPAAVTFGLWGVFSGEVGIVASMIAATSMGLVVDDTVHILSKYNRAKREHRLSTHDAIRFTFTHVGQALWITTFVLLAGFGVLALSNFKINSDMGILTAMAVGVALMLDFLLLPPLLMALDKEPACQCATCRIAVAQPAE